MLNLISFITYKLTCSRYFLFYINLIFDVQSKYNLIKNAEEAIGEKRSKNHELKGNIAIELMMNSDYIEVIIKDNGVGISDLKKVMTPYFTTKKNGTGLGLPIVEKIINEHGGEINIKNSIDGAEALINLPNIKPPKSVEIHTIVTNNK